jgi:hypothetical protein
MVNKALSFTRQAGVSFPMAKDRKRATTGLFEDLRSDHQAQDAQKPTAAFP